MATSIGFVSSFYPRRASYRHTPLRRKDLFGITLLIALAGGVASCQRPPPMRPAATSPERSSLDVRAVARGRAIFADRVIGIAPNLQVLPRPPSLYTAAMLGGPVLAPVDEALPPRFQVRCADCHSGSVDAPPVLLTQSPPPLGRCGHCHRAHVRLPELANREPSTYPQPPPRVPLAELAPIAADGELAFCGRCHPRHLQFGPLGSSSGLVLADEDPLAGPPRELPSLQSLYSLAPVGSATLRGSIKVPSLVGIRCTAPYLHDGSVPTLRALLEPAPGHRRREHPFGIGLSAAEKDDLVAFLESL